jgi:Transcriptional regulators
MRKGFLISSSKCSAVLCCISARNSRRATFRFRQFFLLTYLDRKEVLTMSAIAQKMGHTTAAASGLVARLENLGYVVRSVARDDRRKVMVCITPKGSALVLRIREEMVGNLMKILNHLTPDEQKAWLQIYSKIYDYCQSK